MAYREVTMIEVNEVLRQWLAGVGKKRIAARVGLDPKTVRRYARAGEACGSAGKGEGALSDDVLNEILAALCGTPTRQHGEAWQRCQEQRAFIEAKLDARVRLSSAFAKRSEKMGKMPRVARAPRTPEEAADRRTEQALLRAEHVVAEEKTEPVPAALKKCHLCGGTSFRSVGTGKPSETYAYVPGYFRRVVHTREVVACRCGGCVITAPPPERWSDKTRYDAGFVAHLVVSKCLVVTPHYRLEQMFARLGVRMLQTTPRKP